MSYYIGSLPVVSDSANAKSEHLDYFETVDYAKSQICVRNWSPLVCMTRQKITQWQDEITADMLLIAQNRVWTNQHKK